VPTPYDELARRLSAAVVSYTLDISLRHGYETYMKGRPPGKYWLALAEQILADPALRRFDTAEDFLDN
jgi:hypothetical protein